MQSDLDLVFDLDLDALGLAELKAGDKSAVSVLESEAAV